MQFGRGLEAMRPNCKLLKLDDAANELSISRRTLYRLIAQGEMLLVKVRGGSRIPQSSVNEYVDRLMKRK